MKNKIILFAIFLTISLRIVAAFLPGFKIDITDWQAWTQNITTVGLSKFYSPNYFADYFPGYLYILWVIGKIYQIVAPHSTFFSFQYEFILKTISLLFDLITSIYIYKIIRNYNESFAKFSIFLYLLNPALALNSSVWGQVDGISTFFLVASSYYLIELKNPLKFALFSALAILTKPQSLVALPLLFIRLIKSHSVKFIAIVLMTLLTIPIILSWPFFPNNPLLGLVGLFQKSTSVYPYTSLFAFNFWSLIGWWKSDSISWLSYSYQVWGFVLYGIALIVILAPLILSSKKDPHLIYLGTALSFLAFFLFPTRIHERYLFPFFSFFLIAAFIKRSVLLIVIYVFLSLVYFINLWYVYFYYNIIYNNPNYSSFTLFDLIDKNYYLLSLLTLFIFAILLFIYYKISSLTNLSMPKIKFKINLILVLILLFAFLTRAYQIWYPKGYVFDEVYHAFTAKEFLKGHKEAWEWWTTPPPGVAFEWTHPPLAKELMAASMDLFNTTDSWAYRIPGVLMGVAGVYLVYLLALRLFNKASLGLFAAFIFSIDGLNFVQSRTGMNDIYFVTFMLATLLAFLNKKYFISSIFLGLALASKWTGIYFFGLILILLVLNSALKKLPLFILIPLLVYLGSYIPFFVLGHSLEQFKGLQQQMWWYHTNLKAHHDYASPWWSWPLNLYPVWYFVDYHKNTLSNIFASGNPSVFWLGAGAILLSIKDLFFKLSFKLKIKQLLDDPKYKSLLITLLGYFIFWLPWALSPRIMFLYHFAPSVPFLSLILGYQLDALWVNKKSRLWLILILAYFLLGFIFIYPILVGIPLTRQELLLFFRTNLTKNPF